MRKREVVATTSGLSDESIPPDSDGAAVTHQDTVSRKIRKGHRLLPFMNLMDLANLAL